MTSTKPMVVALGDRIFTADDQRSFAAASRDVNPMHVDAVAARRLLSGRQVVHGIHILMQALDLWRAPAGAEVRSIQCAFEQSVSVGDHVFFTQYDDGPAVTVLSASVNGLTCTEVRIGIGAPEPGLPRQANAAPDAVRRLPGLTAPLDEPPGSQCARSIVLAPWGDSIAATYPHAAARLGPACIAALARLSYFVGMVCPGLHSVFSSLQFSPRGVHAIDEDLTFTVKRYDPRFRLFVVTYDGPLRGELRAFLRPPPQPQPSAREVAASVKPGEFHGAHALVIGGSRGLGELTAKILAAGGGDVIISYALGKDDAQRVADDINAIGAGPCGIVAIDLAGDVFATLQLDRERLTAVYFFATPKIFKKKSGVFEREAFDEFCSFYLERFHQLCCWLEARANEAPITVYFPSTVFVAERPKGMTEYAMAKAAAEVMVDDLNRSLTKVTVVYTRLPRLATDQTAAIMSVSVDSGIDTLLPVVRAVHGGSREAVPPPQMSSATSSL